MITDRHEGAVLASELLRVPLAEAEEHSRDLPEIDAFFSWVPIRGGGRLIVGRDGSVLFGISSLRSEQMIEAFAAGRRTDRSLFGTSRAADDPTASAPHAGAGEWETARARRPSDTEEGPR